MADKYWVGDAVGGDNWNNPNAWASSSGGAGGAGVPAATDDIYFDDLGQRDCNLPAGGVGLASLNCSNAYIKQWNGLAACIINITNWVSGITLSDSMTFDVAPIFTLGYGPNNMYFVPRNQFFRLRGAAGAPSPGAVTGFGVYNGAAQLIVRGVTGIAYSVEANTVFAADTPGVVVRVQAAKITNPAVPVPLPDLLAAAPFNFVAGVTRTLADLNGAPLTFTPPTNDDYLLTLTVANPAAAPEQQVAEAGLTTQPVGPTPPPPPAPPPSPIKVSPIISDGQVQFQGAFVFSPALMTLWNKTGDWGLLVNQPTYAFNSFFVNSISGVPAPGQTAEFRIAIPAGRYTFRLWAPRGPDCGIINIQMNGVSLLTGLDLYNATLAPGSVIAVPLVVTAQGLQSIVFTVAGKNPLSSNFYFRMHQFQLVPYLEGVI